MPLIDANEAEWIPGSATAWRWVGHRRLRRTRGQARPVRGTQISDDNADSLIVAVPARDRLAEPRIVPPMTVYGHTAVGHVVARFYGSADALSLDTD